MTGKLRTRPSMLKQAFCEHECRRCVLGALLRRGLSAALSLWAETRTPGAVAAPTRANGGSAGRPAPGCGISQGITAADWPEALGEAAKPLRRGAGAAVFRRRGRAAALIQA